MLREVNESYKVRKIFEGWQETLIWSCLQGVMGHIYIKDTDHQSECSTQIETSLFRYESRWCNS